MPSIQDVNHASSSGLNKPSFIFNPLYVEKRTCSTCKNCCNKKSNCKCGSQISNDKFNDKKFINIQLRDSKVDFSSPEMNDEDISNENTDLNEVEGETAETEQSRVRTPRKIKEPFRFIDGEYFIDQHPALFKLTPVKNVEDFEFSNSGIDGSRLYSISKSALIHSRFRRRTQTENNQPIQLIDMSAEDIFGALPQSYEGELVRYKRVKRAIEKKIKQNVKE